MNLQITVNHSKIEGLCLLASQTIEEGELVAQETSESHLVRSARGGQAGSARTERGAQIAHDEFIVQPTWYYNKKTNMMEGLVVRPAPPPRLCRTAPTLPAGGRVHHGPQRAQQVGPRQPQLR
jgi:hypothetical protein